MAIRRIDDGSLIFFDPHGVVQSYPLENGVLHHIARGVGSVGLARHVIWDAEQQLRRSGRCIFMVDSDSRLMTLECREALTDWFETHPNVSAHMLTRSDLVAMSCTIANDRLDAPRANACDDLERWLAIGRQFLPTFVRRPLSLPATIAQSAARMALDALKAEDFSRALEHAREARDIADLVATPAAQLVSRCLYGRALMERGELSEAGIVLSGTLAWANQIGHARFVRLSTLLLAECDLRDGRQTAALARLQGVVGGAQPFDPVEAELVVSRSLASLCIQALEAHLQVGEVRELIKQLHLQPDPPPLHVVNWPWDVHVRTMGTTEVRAGRQVLPAGKLTELLFFLAASVDAPVARDTVATALWPESDGDQANNALKTTLHRLRRALGDHDRIRVVEGQLALDVTACWTDVAALRDRMDQVARCVTAACPSTELRSLAQEILKLYRGHFMHGNPAAWGGASA